MNLRWRRQAALAVAAQPRNEKAVASPAVRAKDLASLKKVEQFKVCLHGSLLEAHPAVWIHDRCRRYRKRPYG